MSQYWMYDQATQADYADDAVMGAADPPCMVCEAHRSHVCRAARRVDPDDHERVVWEHIAGFRCRDCGRAVYDDGYSQCVCDGVGVHWEG